jgi:hypothetical protein
VFFFGWGQDEQVFPKLRAVGAVQNAITQELQILRAHIKAAAPLIAMTMKPFYKPSPITERKLAIKQKNFQFLPRDPPFEDENEYVKSQFPVLSKTLLLPNFQDVLFCEQS